MLALLSTSTRRLSLHLFLDHCTTSGINILPRYLKFFILLSCGELLVANLDS